MEYGKLPQVEGYYAYTNEELKKTAADHADRWDSIRDSDFLERFAEELEDEAFDRVEVSPFMVGDRPEQAVAFACCCDRYFVVFRECGDLLIYLEGDRPDIDKLHHYAHLVCLVLHDEVSKVTA